MTYWEETIPADANPGPLVYAALETKLLAIGWTLDDTVVIGARTHKVLKSAAAGNTYGLDWWLDISFPTTGVASGLLLAPFEGYNAATDTATRGPYSASGAVIDGTTYSRFGATGSALETNWVNTGGHSALDTPLVTASFGILASVTRNRVILCASTEATQVSYAGFFTPTAEHAAHAGAALFPLVMTRLSGSTDRASNNSATLVQSALTRIPKFSTITAWGSTCVVGPNTMRMSGRVGAAPSEADNQITSVPFLVGMGGLNWANSGAAHVGELDGVECAWADAAVVRADTTNSNAYATSTALTGACILIEKV